MIRFIVETFSSRFDRNGNRTHNATITSTLTRRAIRLRDVGGPGNAVALLRELLKVDWSEMHRIDIEDIPIRRMKNGEVFLYEHHVTADMLRALEVQS